MLDALLLTLTLAVRVDRTVDSLAATWVVPLVMRMQGLTQPFNKVCKIAVTYINRVKLAHLLRMELAQAVLDNNTQTKHMAEEDSDNNLQMAASALL